MEQGRGRARTSLTGAATLLAAAAVLGPGCAPATTRGQRPSEATRAPVAAGSCADVPFGEPASFAIDKAALRALGASAGIIEKLDASAYRYFRMLGPQFAARACWGVSDARSHLPVAAVHGDAHVEQFVVTREMYGLDDFDQAGYGPAVVDLVRYGASLHLVCHDASWPCRPEEAVSAYFRTYREALERPPVSSEVPRVVERLRSKAQAPGEWLRWADSLMLPQGPGEHAMIRKGWARFVRLVTDVRPDRAPQFYDIVRTGALQMGIGSALEKKLLIRIRGETDAPDDDLVLEARSPPAPSGRACVWRPAHGGSLHVLLFMSLLGRRMPEVHGFVALDKDPAAPELWVQAWDSGYRELAASDIESQAELEELARDAARQLAGHFWTKFPEALRAHQRFAQLRAFDLIEERARRLVRDLSAEAVTEWERFRRAP